jgi:ribonuclease D
LTQPQFISDQNQWERVARQLAEATELAIDTEANSMYAYRGRICLIQIASDQSVYLLDPLPIADLSSLGDILADSAITKVMHGSDYDLRSFYREYGFAVNSLFDTETGARFLGMVSPNLAAVVQRYLDVEIPKSRRLQRSNWALRPLSGEAVAYAAADVLHLISLAYKQRRLLKESGRLAWVEEEFTRLEAIGRAVAELPAPDFLRVKGSGRLNPQELAVLKELFDLREAEAERIDQPPYRVMGNDVLLYLAHAPYTPLEDVPELSPHLARRLGEKMQAGIQKALQGPGIQRPPLPRRTPPSREAQARQQKLKQWRSDKGAALALDPALIWPAASLDRLAQNPDSWETEVADTGAAEVRAWQREQFAGELEGVLGAIAF